MQLVEERIERYTQAYPEIEFKLLFTIDDYEQLVPFTKTFGNDLSNLDYEHPAELRTTLIDAQQHRIIMLLYNGMGSSTLFKTPSAVVTKKPYTCLLTLNHPVVNQKPITSTRFMFDLDEKTLNTMPESLHIDNQDFLLFTLDHEIFHCIDVYTNGPSYPQTTDPIKACSDRARAESRGDIYATLAHLSRKPGGNLFLANLANARTLNLLNWDVEHYTTEILLALANTSKLSTSEDIKTLMQQSMQLAEEMTPTHAEHLQFLAAAWHVVQKFGLDTDAIPDDYAILADERPDPDIVKSLSNEINTTISTIYAIP
ncbi:MAG: hypothetical protein EP297_05245 [Gammaproteobacteria bacterium]|nr:MAG: hypothetical protein EP297_05245 [Gammaproteobacteria bacterium]